MSEDFDVDAAGAQFDATRSQMSAGDAPPAVDDPVIEDDAPGGEAEANPHGHLSYQDWVDAGKDPDDYVGKNAYQGQHERIVDSRKLEKEVKGLKKTQQQTLEAIGDWQAQEQARIRAEIEAELRQAREDEDVDGAIEATEALKEHDAKQKSRPGVTESAEEMGPIQDFRALNPAIDTTHEDFDPEFNAEVELAFNAMAKRAYDQKLNVTDAMIKRWLKKSYKDATELFGDDAPAVRAPAESPRNSRQSGQPGTKRRAAGKQADPRAESYVLEDPRNPRQQNAAAEIRDMIKSKYGDDDAKKFERSLTR